MSKQEKTSSLEERGKELYESSRPASSGIPKPREVSDIVNKEPPPPYEPQRPSFGERFWGWLDRFPLRRGFMVIILLGILVALVLLWRGFFVFQAGKVVLTVAPVENVPVGKVLTWEVTVENNNASAIENATLTFQYPERSLHATTSEVLMRAEREIGRIGGRSSYTEEFEAVFIAGKKQEARGALSFTQEGSNITFDVTESFTVEPEEFPVVIEIEGPKETLPGESVNITFQLENEVPLPLTDLRGRIIYPESFVVSSANENLEEANTIWPLDVLTPGEERTLEITGTINGEAEEGKIFRLILEGKTGPTRWEEYVRESFRAILTAAPLSVSIEGPEDGVLPGDNLTYRIRWRNDFNAALRNVTVAATLEGRMFNLQTLDADGAFNARAQTITWSEAHVPDLATVPPGGNGAVSFSVELAPNYEPLGVTNPRVRMRAVVSSPTKPTGLTTAGVRAIQEDEVPIQGALEAEASGVRTETTAPIENFGPYPPQVGEVSTFTIHWRLSTVANGMEDVRMVATLPSGIEWAGETYINGQFGEITYDEFTREVRWRIDELKANQGIFSTVPEAVFQVRALPAPSQEGDAMLLIEDADVRATDAFTGTPVTTGAGRVDSSLGGRGGDVQP